MVSIAPALAAPFCVSTTALPPQCLYVDPAECHDEATRIRGICTTNPAEFQVTAGVSQFCVTDATHAATCGYADLASCTIAASRRKGSVCVLAQQPAPSSVAPQPVPTTIGAPRRSAVP